MLAVKLYVGLVILEFHSKNISVESHILFVDGMVCQTYGLQKRNLKAIPDYRVAQELETRTVRTVFPGTERELGLSVKQSKTAEKPFPGGALRAENRNRSNRSVHELKPNRTELGPPCASFTNYSDLRTLVKRYQRVSPEIMKNAEKRRLLQVMSALD